MKKFIFNSLSILLAFMLFSCATTVSTTIERPAELDLNGADELSVIPFQSNVGNFEKGLDVTVSVIDLFASIATGHDYAHGKFSDQIDVANYLTNQIVDKFSTTNYMKLIDSSAVQAALNSGSPIPCDVYLTGDITNFTNEIREKIDYEYVEKKVEVDGEIVTKKIKKRVIKYQREVSFDVSYKIIDAETNKITAIRTNHIHQTSYTAERASQVQSTLDCVKYELSGIANTILRQIQPYYVSKTYTLAKDKTKNEQMKTANKLAKNGQLKEAQQLFISLYQSFHYPEALYNSALLLTALHDYQNAKKQLEEYISFNSSSDAIQALADVNNEIKNLERLNRQKAEKGSRKKNVPAKATQKKETPKPQNDEPAPKPSKKGVFTSDNTEIEGI